MSDASRPELGATAGSLEALLEASPDAVVVVDADGRIVHVNSHVTSLLGYEAQELLDETLEVLIPEELRSVHIGHRADYVADPASRAMADGQDLFARHRAGHKVPVDIGLAPLADAEGGPVTAAFVRDATERMRAEEHRHQMRAAAAAQRHALEINDNIIQGLAVIQYALELGRIDEAREAVAKTAKAAQELVDQSLEQVEALQDEPGGLVRTAPALSTVEPPTS